MINKPLSPGDPVTYWPKSNKTGKSNIGILKSITPDNKAYVVFNYNHQPNNFNDYTAQFCDLDCLQFGWQFHIFKQIPQEFKENYHQWITQFFIRTGRSALLTTPQNTELLEDQVDVEAKGFPQ